MAKRKNPEEYRGAVFFAKGAAMIERTLVILKPDAVRRKLCGKIVDIFEEAGFDIVEARFFRPTRELVDRHYPAPRKWLANIGAKEAASFSEMGLDIKKVAGTDDPIELGRIVKRQLLDYMTSGPVFAFVLEGNNAIKNVRKLVGSTYPSEAAPGTIRARFALDTPDMAKSERRSIMNLVHASGTAEEAAYEIELWFGKGKAEV
jgi:nucleoside-diphosphate kinase